MHHRHTIGHGQSLELIVGHIERGHAEIHLQALQLAAHTRAKLGVQVCDRLVEQEHLWLTHDGAADSDTLFLPATEFLRAPVQKMVDFQKLGRLLYPFGDFLRADFGEFERVGDIVKHGLVRIKRIVLKHHGDISILRGEVVDHIAAEAYCACRYMFKTRDHAHGR